MSDEWEYIGSVGVDSGQLMLTDPCYLESEWKRGDVNNFGEEHVGEFSYSGASSTTLYTKEMAGELNYHLGHPGAGVVFSSGYGDGSYPVYVKRDDSGLIAEMRVVMISEDDQ